MVFFRTHPIAINFYDLLCIFFAFLTIFLSSFFLVCQDCVCAIQYQCVCCILLFSSSSSATLSPLSYFNCDFQLTLLRLSFIRARNLSWHIFSHVYVHVCRCVCDPHSFVRNKRKTCLCYLNSKFSNSNTTSTEIRNRKWSANERARGSIKLREKNFHLIENDLIIFFRVGRNEWTYSNAATHASSYFILNTNFQFVFFLLKFSKKKVWR